MSSENKFGMLRKILRTLGLSQQAADDVVNFIVDSLAGERKGGSNQPPEFPYYLRDHFLSPAELNFYKILRETINGQLVITTKVNLNDVLYVPKSDQSRYRIYTNKIDRKHVDFLLCHPITMQPILGIELDDKSHQRKDRQVRDAFVDAVFQAAGLPLVHIKVRRTYQTKNIMAQISHHLNAENTSQPRDVSDVPPTEKVCPKCGSHMILRTAKKGANAGNQFWGCSAYPKCRTILPYE